MFLEEGGFVLGAFRFSWGSIFWGRLVFGTPVVASSTAAASRPREREMEKVDFDLDRVEADEEELNSREEDFALGIGFCNQKGFCGI